MGLMSSSVSICQFQVIGKPPEGNLADWAAERLKQFGFQSIDDIVKEQSVGWVTLEDPHDASFEDRQSFARAPYLTFSMRIDIRKVPRTVLKHHLDKECQEWLDKHPDMRWVPKKRKEELKELVHHRLLASSLAVPGFYDVVWNTDTNILSFTGLSPKATEEFEKLFKETFTGMGLLAIHPYARAQKVVDGKLASALAGANKATSENVVDLIKDNRWLGHEFLLWLSYRTLELSGDYTLNQPGPGQVPEGFVAHINSRLQLSVEGENGTRKSIFTGPQTRFHEVRAALSAGQQITDATIYLEKNEDVWKLTLKGEMFHLGAFKCPKIKMERDDGVEERDEREALFYEKMYLMELGVQMLDSLLASFLAERLGNKWGEIRKSIKAWMQRLG